MGSEINDIDEEKSELQKQAKDRVSAFSVAIASCTPVIGPIVGEIVSEIIPNQRIDRIADMLERLDQKVQKLDNKQQVLEAMESKENIDLLEKGIEQASKALKEERRENIATLLKNSFTDEDLKYIQKKELMSILDELKDVEVIKLRSYGLSHDKAKQFREEHEDIISAPATHINSSQDEIDEAAIHKRFEDHLESLGLLKGRYDEPDTPGEIEFDKDTGKLKRKRSQITSLGRLFLRYLDYEVQR